MNDKSKPAVFFDGCHRYGWIISILTTLAMFAYFMGGLNSTINAIDKRVMRIEASIDKVAK